MKSLHHYVRCLGVGAFILSAPGLVIEAEAQASVAQVSGRARFSTDKKTWQTAQQGSFVGSGAVVQTAANSTLDLHSSGNETSGSLQLAANSVLNLDRLDANDTELDLTAGQITCQVRKPETGARYEVKFPAGIAGIRESGTYRISASGKVEVISGTLIVALIGGQNAQAITISAGQRLDPGSATPISIPADAVSQPPPSAKSQPTTPAAPQNPTPVTPASKGTGLGGSLRKF